MGESALPKRRRTVAARVLLPYAVIILGFALVVGWSVVSQRKAARDADLVRFGYLPVFNALNDLAAQQDIWNAQLNHITAARNPADIRWWFETTLRMGRPKMYGEARSAIAQAFVRSGDESVRAAGQQLLRETAGIEQFVEADRAELIQLFDALEQEDRKRAERLRDALVNRGSDADGRIKRLRQSVERSVSARFEEARAREVLALQLLLGLGLLTVLVGVGMAFYVRRVLRPLEAVTRRAEAVADGDLTPREVVASNDEIGELAATFESMVSAIAQANQQLLSSERLAAIGKMAAHVTHEIRNPLSAMALNVEMLEEELAGSDGETRSLVSAVKTEVDRLTALSNQYLSMARRQPPALEYESVGELATQACEFMRADLERHGVQLRVRIEGEPEPAPVDEAQLKQALYNLIRNAREAMPDGGTVEVGVAPGGDDGDRVVLTIDDDGVGIDEATRAKLFEPFYTTKGRGTGLGLAITKQIVQSHRGSIACEARAPHGTRFRIELPVRMVGDTPSPPPASTEPAPST